MKKVLSTGEVAKLCNVSHSTAFRWINSGKLKAYGTPGGQFKVKPEDLFYFMKSHKMIIPKELRKSMEQRILIADDEMEIRDLIKRLLKTKFPVCKIETAADGIETLIKIGKFSPHLLILDLKMPRLDGYEVCKRLNSLDGNTYMRIILVSGYADRNQEKIRELTDTGNIVFLAKPIDTERLLEEVKRTFDEEPISRKVF